MPPTPAEAIKIKQIENFGDPEFQKQTIGPTALRIQEIEAAIKNYFKSNAQLKGFTAKEIGDGKGFASHISKITLNWQKDAKDETRELPKSVVVKIFDTTNLLKYFQTIGKTMFENIENMGSMFKCHNGEAMFYEFSKTRKINDLQIPRCFYESRAEIGSETPGYIIFEDLCESTKSASFIQGGLTVNQAKEIANNLARLHAFCLTDKSWIHPEMNVKISDFLKDEPGMFLSCIPVCEKIMQENSALIGSVGERVREMMRDNEDMTYIDNVNAELGLPDVLVHGDLWVNNILFSTDDQHNITDQLKAIIDWQCVHPGCVAEDMARFLCVSLSAQNRRGHTMEILKFYYDKLAEYLGNEPPFTFELYEKAYKRCFRFGVNFCVPIMIPLFLKNENLLGENPEEAKKYILELCAALMEDLFESDI